MTINLYSSKQVYAMEQAWFAQGHDSFGLMQQAAWQMAQHIIKRGCQKIQPTRACIWIGRGNNGGDGWLIAYYLQQVGWQVQVITVGLDTIEKNFKTNVSNSKDNTSKNKDDQISDSMKAQRMALAAGCCYQRFEDREGNQQTEDAQRLQNIIPAADIYVDALFGIGLDRAPTDIYQRAIAAFNNYAEQSKALVVAVDIPSGLVASTGQAFDRVAISADITLCLVARKFGLHTKDGMDYAGEVTDIPLIPHDIKAPAAILLNRPYNLSPRQQNSYKGSYGHVLIIGGNRIDGSQGMGGAAILSASSAMATGAGKITVACHEAFHGALLTSLPDAMTIDLHDQDGVKNLIAEASVIAIGMGLGRDNAAQALFVSYIQASMAQGKSIVIDADGLYHLASLQAGNHKLVSVLREYSIDHKVCLTPHSGEAAKLLNTEVTAIEADRLAAIKQCAVDYGGNWVLKGAGSLVLEQLSEQVKVYVCGVGNAGMATAGMGDVLSGVTAGLLAQQDLEDEQRSLRQAVLIHGRAGDTLVNQRISEANKHSYLLVGQRGLQAQDMPAAIRHVMQLLTC